jgi:2-methylisocitrate lyase-like PEP mutase family enzyme
MVRKIQVASDSRSSADFLIIARTDARTGLGLEEALRRGESYAKAGADVVFIESPETEAEMTEIARRIDAPLIANMVNGGRTPMLSTARLAEIGYSMAIFPAVGFLSMAKALESAYADVRDNGTTTDTEAMYSFAEFNKLIGFEDIWAFEKRYPEIK